MDEKVSMFSDLMGSETVKLSPLAESGSNRKYYRLKDLSGSGREVVAVYNDDVAENEAFISIDRALAASDIRVPRVIAVSADRKAYLQEDLGDTSLYDLIAGCRKNPDDDAARRLSSLLDDSMRQLARLHWCSSAQIDFSRCYPVESMTTRDIMWDLNYCKYCFLKPSYVQFDEAHLQDDFDALCDRILAAVDAQSERVFMYRDFQSRNVMVKDDAAWFIDFQGGRAGLFLYDVVSFLWQGRAGFSAEERQRLIDVYFNEALQIKPSLDKDMFLSMLPDVVLFRSLQVLGAYGFRGSFEGKKAFQTSIPAVLHNIGDMADSLRARYPEIIATIERLKHKYDVESRTETDDFDGLTVTVSSFSYKKGYPIDPSGNGGGYVFDCRAIHNPGRYDQYKQLTGMDEPVKRFLEDDGEIQPFIEHVKGLVGPSVDKYVRRGFKSLQVSFGCTGGQHRSVYSAEAIARWLSGRADVRVRLIHREQGIDRYL